MAQDCLTVRGTSRAGTKVEHSEPTTRVRRGGRLTDKSYSRDNRLVPPKSSYRRRSSAPRCRLTLARRWRSCQAFGCSPIKKVRELGSDRSGYVACITQHITYFIQQNFFLLRVSCYELCASCLVSWTVWILRGTVNESELLFLIEINHTTVCSITAVIGSNFYAAS